MMHSKLSPIDWRVNYNVQMTSETVDTIWGLEENFRKWSFSFGKRLFLWLLLGYLYILIFLKSTRNSNNLFAKVKNEKNNCQILHYFEKMTCLIGTY